MRGVLSGFSAACIILLSQFPFAVVPARAASLVEPQVALAKDAPNTAVTTPVGPFQADIAKAGELLQKNDQPSLIEALTILNGVSRQLARPSEQAGLVDSMKGIALARLGRLQAARAALESSLDQFHGRAEIIYLLAALQSDQRDPLAAVRTLKAGGIYHPAMIRALGFDFLRPLWEQLDYLDNADGRAASEDLSILLAQAGWQQSPASAEGEQILARAIEVLVERGAVADADKLLEKSEATETVLRLAIDNRYQLLWPRLEQVVRDRFRQRLMAEVAATATAVAKTNGDFSAMRDYLHVLRLAGDAKKAVEAGRTLADRADRIEAAGEEAFWFVNEYAYALAEAEKPAEAVAQFDKLLAFGIDAYPGLIGQGINRGLLFNSIDRPQEALDALRTLDEKYSDRANLYGTMWIRTGEVCALATLGRRADTAALMAKIDIDAEANLGAAIRAAACLEDKDKVERLLLKGLDDPKQRTRSLIGFTHFLRATISSNFEKRIAAFMTELRARPAVVAKLRTVGRVVEFDGSDIY